MWYVSNGVKGVVIAFGEGCKDWQRIGAGNHRSTLRTGWARKRLMWPRDDDRQQPGMRPGNGGMEEARERFQEERRMGELTLSSAKNGQCAREDLMRRQLLGAFRNEFFRCEVAHFSSQLQLVTFEFPAVGDDEFHLAKVQLLFEGDRSAVELDIE